MITNQLISPLSRVVPLKKWGTRWWFQIFFMFTPKILGNDFQFDEDIFHMGWFNQQLENHNRFFFGGGRIKDGDGGVLKYGEPQMVFMGKTKV